MPAQHVCPRCGSEMELVELGEEDFPLDRGQLCPQCYLVTLTNADGVRVGQGVPVSRN